MELHGFTGAQEGADHPAVQRAGQVVPSRCVMVTPLRSPGIRFTDHISLARSPGRYSALASPLGTSNDSGQRR